MTANGSAHIAYSVVALSGKDCAEPFSLLDSWAAG